MKRSSAPPGLLACAILLWGWQSGHWLPALVLAVVQESLPWLPWRWKAENTAQRTRMLIRCTWASLLWLGAQSAYLLLVQRNAGNMPVVTWFPWSLLPLVLALQTEQRAPGREFDLSLISALLDKKSDAQGDPGLALPLLPLWLACWLFAAACAATEGVWFYPLCSLCVAVLLWQERPRARNSRLWLVLMLAAISLGAVLNLGLFKLQGVLEEWAVDWLLARPQDDPVRSQTALGHIGQLKLSERVILQLNPADEQTRPESILLMNASYNIYQNGVWRLTGNNSFVDLRQELHPRESKSGPTATDSKQLPNLERAWFVPHGQAVTGSGRAGAALQKISILLDTSQTHMLLPLPLGTHSIRAGDRANLHGVSYNPLGSVQGFMQAGQVLFFAEYDGYAHESAPGPKDMQIPEMEVAQLQAILREANIDRSLAAEQVLPRMREFFSQHFRYSTWRDGNVSGRSAVADFLSRNRSGHCEHFATSTVLLLRAAGIPARYATGYLAQEPANFGPGLIVRQRHAHAWVRVYIQDRWQDFDTTPAAWLTEDEQNAHSAWLQQTWFELNAAWYRYRQQASADSGRRQYMLIGLVLLIPAWILIRRRYGAKLKLQLVNQAAPADGTQDQLQLSMLALQQHLAHCALGKMAQESLLQWLRRIEPLLKPQAAAQLGELLQAYYQLRFAPAAQTDSQAWRKAAAEWCQAWPEPGLQASVQSANGMV